MRDSETARAPSGVRFPWPVAAAGLGVALVLGLLEAGQIYLVAGFQGQPITLGFALTTVTTWIILAVLAVPVVVLTRRFRLDRGKWRRHLPVHLAAGLVFGLAHLAGAAWLTATYAGPGFSFGSAMLHFFRFFFALDVLTYWGIVGVVHAFLYYREAREREIAAARLETRLTESRLQALRNQVQPHFLFNTLNAISTLALRGRGEEVVEALGRLADLLRLSLDGEVDQEVTLARELELLDLYLAIVDIRFGDRLVVERTIDPRALEARVPTLVLQPLMENAIVHGIAQTPGPGRVEFEATRQNDRIRLVVRDTGPGFGGNGSVHEGVGIANTRERLEGLYGSGGRLVIGAAEGGGAEVVLDLPYRE